MTHKFYLAKSRNIDIQIAHLHHDQRLLLHQYIEERRMINQGQKVMYEGDEYEFTGKCDIDANGNLLYELDGKSRWLIFKTFEDFEVVG